MPRTAPDFLRQPVDYSSARKQLERPFETAAPSAHIVENNYINGENIRCDAAIWMPQR